VGEDGVVRRDAVMEGEAQSGYDAMLLPVTKPASPLTPAERKG
jgi:hypothetical protein